MTTTVYVIIQHDEYWGGKKILQVNEDINRARATVQDYYKWLWERIEADDDPKLKTVEYKIEQVLFIK
jgi:hypothetical protein